MMGRAPRSRPIPPILFLSGPSVHTDIACCSNPVTEGVGCDVEMPSDVGRDTSVQRVGDRTAMSVPRGPGDETIYFLPWSVGEKALQTGEGAYRSVREVDFATALTARMSSAAPSRPTMA